MGQTMVLALKILPDKTKAQHNVKFIGRKQDTTFQLTFDTTQNLFPDFVMVEKIQNLKKNFVTC